jgi:hypothetical protein
MHLYDSPSDTKLNPRTEPDFLPTQIEPSGLVGRYYLHVHKYQMKRKEYRHKNAIKTLLFGQPFSGSGGGFLCSLQMTNISATRDGGKYVACGGVNRNNSLDFFSAGKSIKTCYKFQQS